MRNREGRSSVVQMDEAPLHESETSLADDNVRRATTESLFRDVNERMQRTVRATAARLDPRAKPA